MIAYVESNFVLELAFDQEDRESCEQIVALAEAGSITLALPAYCVGEPYERMVRRDKQRRDVHKRLLEEVRELGRSASSSELATKLRDLTGLLVEAVENDRNRLNQVLTRLVNAVTLIPVDAEVLRSALNAQAHLGLSPQDSIVYASVKSMVTGRGNHSVFSTGTRKTS